MLTLPHNAVTLTSSSFERSRSQNIGYIMTVTEIANLAGVSIATVDRVLHKRGRVAEETQAKIEKIIKESGYQPDPLARHLKNRSQYHIGILIPQIDSAFGYWQLIYNGIKETAERELSAFSLIIEPYFFERSNEKSLKEAFSAMTESSCNAYIIAPIMQKEIKILLNQPEMTKPYCFLDSSLPGCNPLTEIAQNPYKAGFLAGRLTQIIAQKKGTFIAIKPYEGAFNLDEREMGFIDWFNTNGNTAFVLTKNLSKDSITEEIQKIIASYPNLAGICSVSVETSMIANEIKKLGLKSKIAVTGFDLVECNREGLLNGEIDALIDQNPYEQGVLAVRQIFKKLVYEEDVEKQFDMPIEIFLKENV